MDEFVNLFRRKVGARVGILESLPAANELPANGQLADLDRARSILVVGADPLATHPVVGYRIKKNRYADCLLVVVSDKETQLGAYAQHQFSLAQLQEALDLCRNHGPLVVVYGTGLRILEAQKLATLKDQARFLSLFPATNGYRAKTLGLENVVESVKGKMTYWLVEDKEIDEDTVEQIRQADFVVAQATYHGPLTAAADVVLPAPVWFEREGTFSTLEGKQVAVNKAVPPPPGVLAEKDVLLSLSEKI
jgi:predicted molibdopterin-dependent oxidoreductase YjgC